MLDVHPPEHPAHSWPDFFIHMATICLGLLIALGLEQFVEYMHRQHIVHATERALERETEHNIENFYADAESYRSNMAMLGNNLIVLAYLKQHPGSPDAKVPGTLHFGSLYEPVTTVAWDAAKQSDLVRYLPTGLTAQTAARNELLKKAGDIAYQYWVCTEKLRRPLLMDGSLQHLTPAQIDAELDTLADCRELNYSFGVALRNVEDTAPEFKGAPTTEDFSASLAPLHPAPQNGMETARKLTSDRIDAPARRMIAATAQADKDNAR